MLVMATGDVGRKLKAARLSVRPIAPKQSWLADQLGVSQARLSNWETGKHDPPPDVVKRAAEVLGVDERYFDPNEHGAILGTPLYPVGFPMVRIPYAGVVPAGDWGDPLNTDDFIEVDVRYEHRQRYAARVVGDSCYPALLQGDLTIWQEDTSPAYGLIVLAQRKHDHACTVKELDYDAKVGRPILTPINPKHDCPPDGDGWGAVARLVAVIRVVDGLEQTWFLASGLRKRHLTGA